MWHKLTTKSGLPDNGEAKEFPLGEKTVCLANVNGACAAMDNICVHRGGPLGQGIVMDGKVVCPWHGWMYNPKTGAADADPNARVKVYPLKIEGDDVMVDE